MKFEEVLPLMREGKKARHAKMREEEYWICGDTGAELNDTWPTLIKIFYSPFLENRTTDAWGKNSWGIERWAIMCDTWEIVE